MSLSVGKHIGDYQIIGVLGSGGMGTVYKVQHQISQRVEALKVLLPNLSESPDLADRFIREIRVQASLNHPNIASLHNALRVDNQLLMIMEYVDGVSLYLRLKQMPMPLWQGVKIIADTLSALDYAHGHGVVHRDVKPANIMLTQQGGVKLMDFGIARSQTDSALTASGAAIGSVHYMSPEQIRGQPVDARSDIYSVGVTLYEVVTGLRPFSGQGTYEIMNAHVQSTPIHPKSINSSVPAELSSAILKAIEKNPEHRFQTGHDFLQVLGRLLKEHYAPMVALGMAETALMSPLGPDSGSRRPSAPESGNAFTGPPPLPPGPAVSLERPATPSTPSSSTPSKLDAFDQTRIDALRKDLAQYVGPMARVLVDRAIRRASTWKEVYDLLSREVPAGKERDRFLASRKS